MNGLRILLVDDDEDDYLITRALLSEIENETFNLEWVCTLDRAREEMSRGYHDVYLVDYRLGEGSGLDLLREALDNGCRAPVILLTGKGDHEIDAEAMKVGAADYLVKGQLTAPLLQRSIRHALERAATLEALKTSERRFRTILENIEDGYYEVDLAGNLTFFNDSLSGILGYPLEDLMGLGNRQYMAPNTARHVYAAYNKVFRTGKPTKMLDYEVTRKDRTKRFVEVSISLMHDSAGEAKGFRGIIRDVTERRQAEAALRKSEMRLARAQQIARLGNWEFDLTTNELVWSDEIYRIFGLTPALTYVTLDLFWNCVHPSDRKQVKAALEDALSGKRPYNIDHRIVLPDGSERIIHEQGESIPGKDGRLVKFIGTAQDITERKRMEEALRKSELEYRNLFESANDPIVIFEPESEIILEANNQALETYGFTRDEMLGMSLKKLTKDVGRGEQQIYKIMRCRTYRNFETVHFKKDGTPMDILASSAVIEYGGREAILTINRDMTERRRLQQQLVQSEKMAALGQLVSGVAHELNNPLTSVIGYTELLLEGASVDVTSRERLQIIGREAERARRIINNLLSFARQQKPSRAELDLNELLDRALDLRSYEMRVNDISVERRYGLIPKVLGDGHQLQQALMNIIVNAEQAITSCKKGGTLIVTTESQAVESGLKVAVVITDDGPGITAHQLDKVFDPFFTTRPVGKGAGLGLSITYGIVKEHGGNVFAKSAPGQGATFVVEFPGLSGEA